MNVDWLTSHEGQTVIAAAAQVTANPNDVVRLRAMFPHVPPEDVGAAIHQSWLRRRLKDRWGIDTVFLLTTDGIEQATRHIVSEFHARRLGALAGTGAHIIDMTCGLGFDAAAFCDAGFAVTGVEADPDIAIIASHNVPSMTVRSAKAETIDISGAAAVFVDPARRNPAAARRIDGATRRATHPETWSPPWSWVQALGQRIPVMAKVAPGIEDEFLDECNVDFVSADGDLVEALVTMPGQGRRQAVLLTDASELVVAGGHDTAARELGEFLVIPNPALVRARALDWLAGQVAGGLVHPMISWLTSDESRACQALAGDKHRPATVLRILWSDSYDLKRVKRQVATIPHSAITVMTRGLRLDVDRVRRTLLGATTPGSGELVVAVWRGDSDTRVALCHRIG